jgi:hypothetical protein
VHRKCRGERTASQARPAAYCVPDTGRLPTLVCARASAGPLRFPQLPLWPAGAPHPGSQNKLERARDCPK